jgi:hypothetical protein
MITLTLKSSSTTHLEVRIVITFIPLSPDLSRINKGKHFIPSLSLTHIYPSGKSTLWEQLLQLFLYTCCAWHCVCCGLCTNYQNIYIHGCINKFGLMCRRNNFCELGDKLLLWAALETKRNNRKLWPQEVSRQLYCRALSFWRCERASAGPIRIWRAMLAYI